MFNKLHEVRNWASRFSILYQPHRVLAFSSCAKHVRRTSASSPILERRRLVEKLWMEFFADPSWWWDNRAEKSNSSYPDFKHKKTEESLWLDSKFKPRWVDAELAALPPGTVPVNLFTWNRRLARYSKSGEHGKTIEVFHQMQEEGVNPNKYTFVPVLSACSSLRALEEGRRVHSQIKEDGLASDLYVGSSLVDMYANCGSIEDARVVFETMPIRDVVVWNAMIVGHAKCGQGRKALELYVQMQQEGVEPSTVTFLGLLNACASVIALEEGRHIHNQIVGRGWESDVFVGSSLVDMYAKCGSIESAQMVFNKMQTRNVVAWSAMILGYVKCGEAEKALELSRQMQQEGMDPDPGTFVGVLNACASVMALEEGHRVHKQIARRGWESDPFVSSSLVDMYAKCGSIEDAKGVFGKMPTRDVVVWNAMILGYVKCGQAQEALDLCRQMQNEGVEPSTVTYVGMLNACASLLALEEGRFIHQQLMQRGWESDVFVGNNLVDMYAKCGSIDDAQRAFKAMSSRNVVSWTTMLAGYAMHGHADGALRHFNWMCQEGVDMEAATFVSLLSACSHGGLVDEGLHYFGSMSSVYNISPTADHRACLIDILGRAGHLHEAEDVIKTMSSEPNSSMWMSLLGACSTHGNVEMGEQIAKHVQDLEPENAAGYVLLSNIYAAAGRWDNSVHAHQKRFVGSEYD